MASHGHGTRSQVLRADPRRTEAAG